MKTLRFSMSIIGLLALTGCTLFDAGDTNGGASSSGEPSSASSTISLYFYTQDELDNAAGDPTFRVDRMVESENVTPDELLVMLFRGPTAEEQAAGARTFEGLTDLEQDFLGVTVEENVAIVNFEPEALDHLNNAAAYQVMTKSPIEKTLKAFLTITEVQYAIEGEIFDEWDA